MRLIEKQYIFVTLIARLIDFAYKSGYTLTFGEALRTPEQAHLNAVSGAGIEHSLHLIKLAIDFNLFKNGIWLKNTSDFEPLGLFWESLSTADYTCCWGGRFNDGDHFSIEQDGVK